MTGRCRRRLVVGVDHTPEAQVAVRWVVEEAGYRNCPVRVISAYEAVSAPAPFDTRVPAGPPASLRERFDDAVAYARDRLGRDRVDSALVPGKPATVLLAEARSAELVVVGSRPRSTLGAIAVGSVGDAVAAHAACSVVVARTVGDEPVQPRIVVGVDDSDGAAAAVSLAFEAADSRNLALDVAHCWQPFGYASRVRWSEDVIAVARRRRKAWMADKIAGAAEKHPAVHAATFLLEGRAGAKLVAWSRHAALLVVGSRGHGGVAGLLLGSVSQHVVHHAHCTVMVAREAGGDGRSGA
ncbi:MAG: hypothetical protein GEV10_27665 [Streptosporangiales bacterium]|nr:hypothetical protein [Streptosporangiales bacterium]